MKGKIALFSVALLFVALIGIMTFSTPVVAGSTITVDGDPSDWTGTAGSDNTYVVSAGEGIWKDALLDDTGNGSYIYPNGTESAVNDSAGNPADGKAWIYTGWPHGGYVDLTEFRVTADGSNLYLMARTTNMCNTALSTAWDGPDYGFGKLNVVVAIDKDRVPGSGRTDMNASDSEANFDVVNWQAWEALITIQGNSPRVELDDGSMYYLDNTTVYGDANIYPSCIEAAVPLSVIGDPAGQTWRFAVFVGGSDGSKWRQVWNTTAALGTGWAQFFKFIGGDGVDSWMGSLGWDPNAVDMAFTKNQAAQEAEIGGFTWNVSLASIEGYQDVTFATNGDVTTPFKLIDGNPSDWTGTPGGVNTFVSGSPEAIWTDAHNDDTGNGSYIYPNGTHTDIPDSAGAPDGYAYIYTGWPHGGFVDLTEFRMVADSNYLYLMARTYNMGNAKIAEQWGDASRHLGKIEIAVAIDTDRDGTGRTDMNASDTEANFNLDPECAWETLIHMQAASPRVELEDGSMYYLTHTELQGDGDYSCVEAAIPLSVIGDPAGQTWRFTVVVGGEDGGKFRNVWNTTFAASWGWPLSFKFIGGEGADSWCGGLGNDPNIIDMAFAPDLATQEAEIADFSSLAVINMWRDVVFSGSGGATPVGGEAGPWNLLVMAPWIILALAIVAATVSVVLYSKKQTVKI